MIKKSLIATSTLLALLGCASSPHAPSVSNGIAAVGLNAEIVHRLNSAVFEVVVPQYENKNMKTAQPLPYHKLPIQERASRLIGIGTAFSVEKGRYISAAHVFSLETKKWTRDFFIRDQQGSLSKVVKVTKYDELRDLIEFQVENPPSYHGTLSLQNSPQMGQPVFTVGNAFGEGIAIRGGQIASFTLEDRHGQWKYIRYSAPASPGNSGGPLVNGNGAVCGVVVMKNASENLNYAVPIKEFSALRRAEANYKKTAVEFKIDDNSVSRDFQLKISLPTGLHAFADQYHKATLQFMGLLWQDYQKKYGSQLYPLDPRLSRFLQAQRSDLFFSELHYTKKENWHFHNYEPKKIEIEPGRILTTQQPQAMTYYYTLPKPKNQSLQQFVEDPERILDDFLKTINWYVEFAGEKISVLSYGEPHRRTIEKDSLGRSWMTSYWRNTMDDSLIINECMAIPVGVACIFTYNKNAAVENISEIVPRSERRDKILYSPFGKLHEWNEFFALKAQYRWSVFANSKMHVDRKLGFSISNDKFVFNAPYRILDEQSVLFSFARYNPSSPSRLDDSSWMIIDKDKNGYIIQKMQPLSPNAKAETRAEYRNLRLGKGIYSGKLSTEDGVPVILYGFSPSQRSPASLNDNSYTLVCRGTDKVTGQQLKTKCAQIKRGISLATRKEK